MKTKHMSRVEVSSRPVADGEYFVGGKKAATLSFRPILSEEGQGRFTEGETVTISVSAPGCLGLYYIPGTPADFGRLFISFTGRIPIAS